MAFHTVLDTRLLAAALILLAAFLVLYLTFSGFSMVGITPGEVVVLLFISPFLAGVNIPLWTMPGLVIGINAAGLAVPVLLSIRFLLHDRVPVWKALTGTAIVSVVAYHVSTVDPSQGILVPALPLMALTAVVGLALTGTRWREVGPLTYTSGAMGVLIGADVFHIGELVDPSRSEPLYAVIGGAGTLDAIFLIALWSVVGTILAVVAARILGAKGARSKRA